MSKQEKPKDFTEVMSFMKEFAGGGSAKLMGELTKMHEQLENMKTKAFSALNSIENKEVILLEHDVSVLRFAGNRIVFVFKNEETQKDFYTNIETIVSNSTNDAKIIAEQSQYNKQLHDDLMKEKNKTFKQKLKELFK